MDMATEKPLRDSPVQVQLTANEKAHLVAAAEARGISASTLLRMLTLHFLDAYGITGTGPGGSRETWMPGEDRLTKLVPVLPPFPATTEETPR